MSKIKTKLTEPVTDRRLLNPIDRISEILFGLIMALTFTCTISVINAERTEIKDLLISAIGCNIAWGLVDGVMFLLMTMTEKGRGQSIFNFVRHSKDIKKSHQFIANELPPLIASVMQEHELESIRKKLINLKSPNQIHRLSFNDYKIALGILILVFLSTLPIVIPFILINDIEHALRTSNLTAIVMMFICGWFLGKYAGRNSFRTGILMSLIGVILVIITIYLGG